MPSDQTERARLQWETPAFPPLYFAASLPERTSSLVLLGCHAMLRHQDDYPWGIPSDVLDKLNEVLVSIWGTGEVLRLLDPKVGDDDHFREWYGRMERGTASPSTFALMRRVVSEVDLRGILPSIKAPSLVIAHSDAIYIRPEYGRFLAEHIPNARYIERPGIFDGALFWRYDADWILDEVETFLTGTRRAADLGDRVLATVLFTDIVSSAERAAAMGDKRWRSLLDDHDALVRREIERFRGREVKSTGDGTLATFDGPARAIRCAVAIGESVRSLGIEVRTGLHTGEVELRGEDVAGMAVNIAARVIDEARAGEVLVSGAVPPLVAGSGIEFEDLGTRELKGVGEWRLFAVRP